MLEKSFYRATALGRFLTIRTGFVAAFCHEKRSPAVIKPWSRGRWSGAGGFSVRRGTGWPGWTVAH